MDRKNIENARFKKRRRLTCQYIIIIIIIIINCDSPANVAGFSHPHLMTPPYMYLMGEFRVMGCSRYLVRTKPDRQTDRQTIKGARGPTGVSGFGQS
jgi:hypothetical protein